MVDFVRYLYDLFGLDPARRASTRPEKRLGTDEQCDRAEGALEQALKRHEFEYAIGEGEGTFYGPKIDLHMTDSLGRSWQMGTIQLDYQMPVRFGLTYVGADNEEHHPVVIHRALLGSLERFIGILIEHYARAFPFWIAPVQIRLLPVGDDHRQAADALARSSASTGSRSIPRTRRSASGSGTPSSTNPVRDRLRRQGVGRVACDPRARGQSATTLALADFQAELARLAV